MQRFKDREEFYFFDKNDRKDNEIPPQSNNANEEL